MTKLAIERPSLIIVLFTVLLFLGALGFTSLNYELLPKFNPPVIGVITIYPGASPSEVERRVTKVIEDGLSALQDVKVIKSISQENVSIVNINLNAGADVGKALQEATRLVGVAKGDLAEGAQTPVLIQLDFSALPVLRVGVEANLDATALYDFVRKEVQPQLGQINGVGQVDVLGGRERVIEVSLDPQKLAARRVSLLQVVEQIQRGNQEFPTGKLLQQESQILLRVSGRFADLEALKTLVIAQSPYGGPIELQEIATIRDTEKENTVISRTNGAEGLSLAIRKRTDANAVEMSAAVRAALGQLMEQYQYLGLEFEVAKDSSAFTLEAVDAVLEDLGFAVILVSLVMLLFLHSWRNSLIVLVSIPTSIISTMIVVYLLDYSLNLMTLLGFSLAIGILVDDSIVVIENIYRHLEMRKTPAQAAYDGRMEIGFTALSITLIDVVVFLPIVFAQGLVADLFRQFSVVIVTSTLMSLLVSFTLVPWLASRFSRLEEPDKGVLSWFYKWFDRQLDRANEALINALKWCLRYSWLSLFIAFALFIGSFGFLIFDFIGLEFTQAGDRGEFLIELELPKEATLDQTNAVTKKVEAYLLDIPEVVTVATLVGTTTSAVFNTNTTNLAELNIQLVEKTERDISTSILARKIKIDLEGQLPGVKVRSIELNLLGFREDDAVQVTLRGENTQELARLATEVMDTLSNIAGTIEVKSTLEGGYPELQIEMNRRTLSDLGLSVAQAGVVLRTAFSGNQDAKFRENKVDYDIDIKLSSFNRRAISDVENLSLINRKGQVIPFKQFATIQEGEGPAVIEHYRRQAAVTVKSQVIGRSKGGVGSELQRKMATMDFPPGISYEFGGQTQRMTESFLTLSVALVTSILFVYLIMVALYNSYFYPFIVLFSIPMAIVGAFLALALSQQNLNIFSILGLLMLVGLVGKNAILVVDFTNQLKETGKQLKEALLEATRLRFRPILMTNISMIIGLLPIALAAGAGSEWKNGLAWALIGGLSSSMFLSLLIVPVVYFVLDRFFDRMGWLNQKTYQIKD